MIDWTNPSCPISQHFTVREALWLPKWGRLAAPGDGLDSISESALIRLFAIMDVVRDFIGIPIYVHCAYRPKQYNSEVGGASSSSHMSRLENGVNIAAVDWHANIENAENIGQSCDILRAAILPKLSGWGLRMEDNGIGADWIHVDTHPVISSRYFKP